MTPHTFLESLTAGVKKKRAGSNCRPPCGPPFRSRPQDAHSHQTHITNWYKWFMDLAPKYIPSYIILSNQTLLYNYNWPPKSSEAPEHHKCWEEKACSPEIFRGWHISIGGLHSHRLQCLQFLTILVSIKHSHNLQSFTLWNSIERQTLVNSNHFSMAEGWKPFQPVSFPSSRDWIFRCLSANNSSYNGSEYCSFVLDCINNYWQVQSRKSFKTVAHAYNSVGY